MELPTFLSTVSMVGDDHNAIVHALIQAERKSPSVYEPSRDLFLRVLEGRMDFKNAAIQAWRLPDETERKCAVQILDTSERYLTTERPSRISLLPSMSYRLPNDLPLKIAPVRIRHLNPDRLLVLHFWRDALTNRQLSAAAAVLRHVLFVEQPQYSACEIDFISVARSTISGRRNFQRLNWTKLKPMPENELERFWGCFLKAWSQYQQQEPREFKQKRQRGLFD